MDPKKKAVIEVLASRASHHVTPEFVAKESKIALGKTKTVLRTLYSEGHVEKKIVNRKTRWRLPIRKMGEALQMVG